jgi:hypothetical protein
MLCFVFCVLLVVKRMSEGIESEGAGKSCLLSLVWVVGCRPENLGGNLMALQSYRTGIYDARAVFFGPITPFFVARCSKVIDTFRAHLAGRMKSGVMTLSLMLLQTDRS